MSLEGLGSIPNDGAFGGPPITDKNSFNRVEILQIRIRSAR